MADDPAPPVTVTLGEIFRAFLLTGATSFGGGVMASLLTVGGGLAAFPQLKTLTVGTYHWLTEEQLIHLYSLGQAAPGLNTMMVNPALLVLCGAVVGLFVFGGR